MDLMKKTYFRRVFSSLDLLASIGGLFGAIQPICGWILAILNYYNSYQFIMGDLFIESLPSSGPPESESGKLDTTKKRPSMKVFTHAKELKNDV